jgi:hypothetical protein
VTAMEGVRSTCQQQRWLPPATWQFQASSR